MSESHPNGGDMTKELLLRLRDPSIFQDGALILDRRYEPVQAIANGRKGVVWQVKDRLGRLYAAKITLSVDYEEDGKSIENEMELRRKLTPPLFTDCVDIGKFAAAGIDDDFVVMVETWVEDGVTLRDFIVNEPHKITTSTIVSFAKQMASVLDALENSRVEHDDLHARNIILRPSRPGEIGDQDPAGNGFQLVVIDTGSLKYSERTKKAMSDVDHIADHIAHLHNVVNARRELSLDDRRLLFLIKPILDAMTEDDATRSIRTGQQLRDAIAGLERNSKQPLGTKQELRTPFEYINAEQIRDDGLLLTLFAETSWLNQLTAISPNLLTGPRGCGKSMVLRWLALRTHASQPSPVPLGDLRVSGVYVSCASDVQTRLSTFRSDGDVQGMEGEIVHFFNLLHVLELLRTLDTIVKRTDRVSVFGLGPDQEANIYRLVEKHLAPASPTVRFNPSPISSAVHLVENELFASERRLYRKENAPTAPVTLIADITSDLVEVMPFFIEHPIAFLLDDFSTHRVSAPVQRLVGDIVWERRSSHMFKVSSEKYGAVHDWSGLTAEPDRDRLEIDCGAEFVGESIPGIRKANRAFITRLLDQRLRAAGWQGSAHELIGDSPTHDEMRDALQNGKAAYYGLGVLALLCSGDIAALLMLYRRILSKSGSTSTETVGPSAQHEAAVEVSRLLVNAVVHHRPIGDRLFGFAQAFGNFVGSAYLEGRGIMERNRLVPIEVPRIEVESDLGIEQDLTADQLNLTRELIRRSVFIEMSLGRSRHSRLSTLRWHFRRIYLPAYRAGLHKNDAVKVTPAVFQELLDHPELVLSRELAERKRARQPKHSKDGEVIQLELYDENEFGVRSEREPDLGEDDE